MDYLSCVGKFNGFLHTDYKTAGGPWYHGNPIKGWQDWVKVNCNAKIMMCHILVFVEVTSVMENNTTSLTPGKYALVHFVNQDVFSEHPNQTLYGHTYDDFYIDGNCRLVTGRAKKTSRISCTEDMIASGIV